MNSDARSENRGVWALIIIIGLVIGLALYAYLTESSYGEADLLPPPVTKWDSRVVELEKQAMEEAFKKHLVQLFFIWVTDNYQPRIPPKALTGARNARDAYIRTMEALERREAQIEIEQRKESR